MFKRLKVAGVVIVAFFGVWCLWVIQSAEREYAAYNQLRSLGASGDDWFSLTELITSRPPIVSLSVPKSVPCNVALDQIARMPNLEYLELEYDRLSDLEVKRIAELRLHSIAFRGDFPHDDDIQSFANFRGIRFLKIQRAEPRGDIVERLNAIIPGTKITIDEK
jgi:hypothetical protein